MDIMPEEPVDFAEHTDQAMPSKAKEKHGGEAFLLATPSALIAERPAGPKTQFSIDRGDVRGDLKRDTHYLILGFDTEYQQLQEFYTNKEVRNRLAKYEVLSYQFYAINYTGAEWSGIAIPEPGRRLSFTEFLVYALGKGAMLGEPIPKTIILVGHYNRADVPAFDDTKQIFPRLKNVRNSLVSLGMPVKVRIAFSDAKDDHADVNVYVRDTILLTAANRKSLAQIAPLVGVEKIKLADNNEEDRQLKKLMKLVRADDWNLFREYALLDAEICARYYKRLADTVADITGDFAPTALSSIGMKLLIKDWEASGLDPVDVVGRERVEEKVYDDKRHIFRTQKREPFIQELHYWIDFATDCYHGGRNEQMWFGPSPVGDYSDYDLSGAYPTVMAGIGRPRWTEAHTVRTFSEIAPDDLGLVWVDFEFPASTRYPVLPVRSQNGIIFPLKGRSCCAMPEIELARQMGCRLNLLLGISIPRDVNDKIFFPFIKQSIANRFAARDAGNEFDEAFWKEATNSCYGKTAQGLRDKRVFNLRTKRGQRVSPSPITNPFLAAEITSGVRAVVGEIMNRIPAHRMVFSVTTDGFITDATEAEMAVAKSGPLAQKFGRLRQELTGIDDTLKEKHSVRQLLGWRTRGQATLRPGEAARDESIVLARAGIKPPIFSTELDEQNAYIVETFLDRSATSQIDFQVHTSIRETILWDADLVSKKIPRRISMEFDFKRKPHAVAMLSGEVLPLGRKFEHVVFSTRPWETIEEFNKLRRFWDDHWSTNRRCIKTLGDFRDFARFFDMIAGLDAKDAPYLKRTPTADVSRLQRDLCRAFKHGQAGLASYQSMSAADFAALLNDVGLQDYGIVTTRATVENGKRAVFKPHTTPRTARIFQILERLTERLPNLEAAAILTKSMIGYELEEALSASCQFIDRVRGSRSLDGNYRDNVDEGAASVRLY
ncbi:hypothetical protein XF30_03340 [Bradyrhizobium sp. SUTN9-2]|uniref:DNA polymerase n=1 Tax=Bradyrhizobium sp. SUTN9-2 TaxID=1167456 RepID=UPI000D64446B|nr:DNA polymerase [Bradyrhizobium sp. SUTN9-2]PWE75934.1 hypothetical protein XF30_03340 [Bradyrhizobium sp. SUTN9-2]